MGAGGQLVKVRPHGITQVCFRCRKTVPKKLSDMIHNFSYCGFAANRDHNAARNVLRIGLRYVNAARRLDARQLIVGSSHLRLGLEPPDVRRWRTCRLS
ncbi:MAG: transposase [Desulfobacteraceae bacterium]|nr:transposase [Desulfobacteraceae bacterium]